jgi:hypothetical protein
LSAYRQVAEVPTPKPALQYEKSRMSATIANPVPANAVEEKF